MKFAVAALLVASTSAVLLQKKGDNGSGLSYALDVPTLNKAEADNVAKTQHFNGATKAQADAAAALGASTAAATAAAGANAAAGAAKAATAGAFSLGNYKSPDFAKTEAEKDAAIKAKEAALDASLKADDDKVTKTLIEARKQRDLDASTAAKAASDANLKANQERVAYEKDQLERGENQDRHKFRNEETAAKTSEIQGKHDERERANGRLLKALASF